MYKALKVLMDVLPNNLSLIGQDTWHSITAVLSEKDNSGAHWFLGSFVYVTHSPKYLCHRRQHSCSLGWTEACAVRSGRMCTNISYTTDYIYVKISYIKQIWGWVEIFEYLFLNAT